MTFQAITSGKDDILITFDEVDPPGDNLEVRAYRGAVRRNNREPEPFHILIYTLFPTHREFLDPLPSAENEVLLREVFLPVPTPI
jgi:hypothetical protein